MGKKSSKQLYNKLLFTYTAVIFCVVFVLMLYFWNSMRNRYQENSLEHLQMMQEEAVQYVKTCREVSDYLHEELYKSDMEMKDLLHYLTDDPEEYQQYRLDAYSKNYLLAYRGLEDFCATAFEAYPSLLRFAFASYSKLDLTSINRSKSTYHTEDGGAVLERIRSGNLASEGEFSFLKEIRDPVTMQSVGAMVLTFDTADFERVCTYYEKPELVVYNGRGSVIFDSGVGEPWEVLEVARKVEALEEQLNSYVLCTEAEDCIILSAMKKKEAAELPFQNVFMIFGTGFLVFVLGEIMVRSYLQRVSARLNRILDGMTRVMGGDLTVRLAAEKNGDELEVIAQHFNEMCEKLDLHIQKSYLAEIEQKNAEMAALQSQINPHFLYNTLEAIRMKAICNGDQEVGKMLYSMAVTFRSQLKEADVITMAQELHYCKKYLELFEYRYPRQFQSYVDCPLEYMNVPIIKFVLQPIMENYFIHGIRMRDQDNYIRISVRKPGDDFEIVVEDNGRGMSEEEIREKNQQLQENRMDQKKAIGIANVNRRVKAVYGSAYGLRMEAVPEGGLRVILRFADQSRKDEDQEVQSAAEQAQQDEDQEVQSAVEQAQQDERQEI